MAASRPLPPADCISMNASTSVMNVFSMKVVTAPCAHERCYVWAGSRKRARPFVRRHSQPSKTHTTGDAFCGLHTLLVRMRREVAHGSCPL